VRWQAQRDTALDFLVRSIVKVGNPLDFLVRSIVKVGNPKRRRRFALPAHSKKGLQLFIVEGLSDMVGTPRFELGASPTPRVRATRLRHVPFEF
jgi:hypothetical protein